MREIKFRAWVPEAESFIYTDDFTGVVDNQTILLWGYGDWRKLKVECVQQFTGLKDKNGKEIYEGDILLLHQFLFDGHEFENELIGEVVYDQETCSFALRNIRNADVKKYMGYKVHEDCGNIPIFNFYGLHEESFEKLGDIYENPELLEWKE